MKLSRKQLRKLIQETIDRGNVNENILSNLKDAIANPEQAVASFKQKLEDESARQEQERQAKKAKLELMAAAGEQKLKDLKSFLNTAQQVASDGLAAGAEDLEGAMTKAVEDLKQEIEKAKANRDKETAQKLKTLLDGEAGKFLGQFGIDTNPIKANLDKTIQDAGGGVIYYTQAGDKTYAYSGSPDTGWSAYKQSDLKAGNTKPLKVKGKDTFKSSKLDRKFNAAELEEFKVNLSESRLNRRSLRFLIESFMNEEDRVIPKQKDREDFKKVKQFAADIGLDIAPDASKEEALTAADQITRVPGMSDSDASNLKSVFKSEIEQESADDFSIGSILSPKLSDIADDYNPVYTVRGESGYAYTGSPEKGWTAYKQSDLKNGKVKPINKGFKSGKLDDLYGKENGLEVNDDHTELLANQKQDMTEGLSRGSLYRRRYRRY